MRKVRDDASMVDPSEAEVKLFPPAMSRRKPKWFWDIDSRFSVLFNEIYAALDAGSSALPVMGARTILDMVIQDQVGDQGTFKLGLDALANKGLLSKHDRSLLEAAIEAGNAAAHRGFTPTAEDVVRVIEIVEHLVCSLYVLKAAAKGLKRVTPKRRRARKRQAAVAPKTSTPP